MDVVYGILVVLHLLAWAVTLGGALAALKDPRISPGVMHGAVAALLVGLLLVGLRESGAVGGPDVDVAKIAVKLVIALLVVALAVVGRRQPERVSKGYLGAIAGLVAVNVAVAVLW